MTPDDEKGYWKRQYDDAISVKWFGASGDFNRRTVKGDDNNTSAFLRLKVRCVLLLC
jgi:hypothetical protein